MEGEIPIERLLEHAGWLRALAASLVGDPAQADDLVQDTWVAALRRPPEGPTPPGPWLARVLRNAARNRHRGESRRRAREAGRAEPVEAPSAEALAQEAEAQRGLAEAITRLAEPLRAVVVLRFFHGLDSNAIARELNAPAGTVRWRLARALDELRARLDQTHGERDAWVVLLTPLARRIPPSGTPGTALASPVVWAIGFFVLVGVGIAWSLIAPDSGSQAKGSVLHTARLAPPAREPGGEPAQAARTPLARDRSDDTSEPVAPTEKTEEHGAEISGIVWVNGRVPESPVRLRLSTPTHGRAVDAMEGPDPQPPPKAAPSSLHSRYKEDGSFRLWGLPEGWRGRLSAEGYSFEDGTNHLDLQAPAAGLVLRLVRDPAITGRIVAPDGAPVPKKSVLLSYFVDSPAPGGAYDSSSFTGFETDDEGAFRIPIEGLDQAPPHALEARAWLVVELDTGTVQLESEAFDPTRGLELGDVALLPTRTVELVVRDLFGAPIPAAVGRLAGPIPYSRASAPTDSEGETRLTFFPAGARLRIDALRHRTRVLDVGDAERVEVELDSATGVTIRCLVEDPSTLPSLRIAIVAPSELFSPDPECGTQGFAQELESWVREELGATPIGTSRIRADGLLERLYRPDVGGRVHLAGPAPGVAFRIEVRGSGEELLAARSMSVDSGHWTELEIPLPR